MTLRQEIELRNKIVQLALLQHNKEYKLGKRGPDYFDCAGLAWFLYNELMNIDIFKDGYGKSTTTKIMTSSEGVLIKIDEQDLNKDISDIKKGDILLIHRQSLSDSEPKEDNKYPGHCGIYIGNGKFIHATKVTNRVCISHIDQDNHWKKKLVGYKKIIKLKKDFI